MDDHWQAFVLRHTGASAITHRQNVQTLWSGYGTLWKLRLADGAFDSVVLKSIVLPDTETLGVSDQRSHPRGWGGRRSDLRKRSSYQIECEFYLRWATHCESGCRVAKPIAIDSDRSGHRLLLEDLDAAGFERRVRDPRPEEITAGLSWLAHFHATFLDREPDRLWRRGTYWHLDTRPDEWSAMPDDHPLKIAAERLDQALHRPTPQTIVHGDAKLGNFCFGDASPAVAAVDFQYVGGGCGMSDVAYFLGSCLMDDDLQPIENDLLDQYFDRFASAADRMGHSKQVIDRTCRLWRGLFPVAWADFTRFLVGWSPGHPKLTGYSETLAKRALDVLKRLDG